MRFFFLAHCLLAATALFCQPNEASPYSYQVGELYPAALSNLKVGVKHSFTYQGKMYNIIETKNNYTLVELDPDRLTRTFFEEFPRDVRSNKFAETAVKSGAKVHLIYQEWQGQKIKNYHVFFCQTFDLKSKTKEGKPKVLVKAPKLSKPGFLEPEYDRFYFDQQVYPIHNSYALDSASSHFLIQYRVESEEDDQEKSFDKIGLHVFDMETMAEEWGGVITLPFSEAQMDNLDFHVNEKGEALLLARVAEENTERRSGLDGNVNHQLVLFSYSGTEEKPKTREIPVGEEFFITWVKVFSHHFLGTLLAGRYTEDPLQRKLVAPGTKGMFYRWIDKDSEEDRFYKIDFPVPFVNKNAQAGAVDYNLHMVSQGIDPFFGVVIKKILAFDQGGLMFILEIPNFAYFDNDINTCFSEIVVVSIDEKDGLKWMTKIPKLQQSTFRRVGKLSFHHIPGDQYQYFFFIDNKENVQIRDYRSPEEYKDDKPGALFGCRMDNQTGEVEKHMIFLDKRVTSPDGKMKKMERFETNDIYTLPGGHGFIIEGYMGGGKNALIKVTIRD